MRECLNIIFEVFWVFSVFFFFLDCYVFFLENVIFSVVYMELVGMCYFIINFGFLVEVIVLYVKCIFYCRLINRCFEEKLVFENLFRRCINLEFGYFK